VTLRRVCLTLIGVLAGAALQVAAFAANCASMDDPESDAGLRHAEQRWVDALAARDVAALDCLLDPGFVDSDWKGGERAKSLVLDGAWIALAAHETLVRPGPG
jgi:hypothetical protein